MRCFAKRRLMKRRCVLHFELQQMDTQTKRYANLSNDRARMGKILYLPRRTILCNNPTDLPIAAMAILLHSNKIYTNLLKEIWDAAFLICNMLIKMPRTNHLAFGCNAQQVCCFLYFLFLAACIVTNCKKYTNHNWFVFSHWVVVKHKCQEPIWWHVDATHSPVGW